MKTIKLAASWSHHTLAVTTDYLPGEHQVSDEVYDAAVAAGAHKEKADGDRTAKAGAASAADPVES